MASITITVPDQVVSRIVTALEKRFGRVGGETDTELVKRVITNHLKETVKGIETEDAVEQASKDFIDLGLS